MIGVTPDTVRVFIYASRMHPGVAQLRAQYSAKKEKHHRSSYQCHWLNDSG